MAFALRVQALETKSATWNEEENTQRSVQTLWTRQGHQAHGLVSLKGHGIDPHTLWGLILLRFYFTSIPSVCVQYICTNKNVQCRTVPHNTLTEKIAARLALAFAAWIDRSTNGQTEGTGRKVSLQATSREIPTVTERNPVLGPGK